MANVWNRLYEDGLDKMEARFVVEEQPFPFHPDIGDSMHYEPSGEVSSAFSSDAFVCPASLSLRNHSEYSLPLTVNATFLFHFQFLYFLFQYEFFSFNYFECLIYFFIIYPLSLDKTNTYPFT